MTSSFTVQRELHPAPGKFGAETLDTVVLAQALTSSVQVANAMVRNDCYLEWDDPLRLDILTERLGLISPRLDWLDYLLDGRKQTAYLRTCWPRSGVEFGGMRYICASKIAQHVAVNFLLALARSSSSDYLEHFVLRLENFGRITPVITPDLLAFSSRESQEMFDSNRPDLEELNVLLANEKMDIEVQLGRRKGGAVTPQETPRNMVNEERDRKFADLADSGKTHKQIAAAWNKDNPDENVSEGAVSKAIQRHRKRSDK